MGVSAETVTVKPVILSCLAYSCLAAFWPPDHISSDMSRTQSFGSFFWTRRQTTLGEKNWTISESDSESEILQ